MTVKVMTKVMLNDCAMRRAVKTLQHFLQVPRHRALPATSMDERFLQVLRRRALPRTHLDEHETWR